MTQHLNLEGIDWTALNLDPPDLHRLDGVLLAEGSHEHPREGMCLLEAISWLVCSDADNARFSAMPNCVPVDLARVGHVLNDRDWLPEQRTAALLPLIPYLLRAPHGHAQYVARFEHALRKVGPCVGRHLHDRELTGEAVQALLTEFPEGKFDNPAMHEQFASLLWRVATSDRTYSVTSRMLTILADWRLVKAYPHKTLCSGLYSVFTLTALLDWPIETELELVRELCTLNLSK